MGLQLGQMLHRSRKFDVSPPRFVSTLTMPTDPIPVSPYRYRDPRVLGNVLVALLGTCTVLFASLAVLNAAMRPLFERAVAGEMVLEEEFPLTESQGVLAAQVSFGFYLLTALVFMLWTYRIVANAHVLSRRDCPGEAGWGVVSFFIPVVNLWIPYRLLRDAWVDLTLAEDKSSGRARILVWWLSFVISVIVSRGVSLQGRGAETAEDFLDLSTGSMLATSLRSLSGVFAIVFVRLLTRDCLARRAVTPAEMPPLPPQNPGPDSGVATGDRLKPPPEVAGGSYLE